MRPAATLRQCYLSICYLRSEQIKGKDRAYLIPLDKLHEPPSLRILKARKGASSSDRGLAGVSGEWRAIRRLG